MRTRGALPLALVSLVLALPAAPDGPRPQEAVPVTSSQVAPTKAALAPVNIPPDGKYENVRVEGVTRPMINIMNGGTVVLVDTDGKKPRTWEEQFKRKGDLPKGYFDLHKTDVNRNGTFEDDPIDRQGRWKMDEKGNISQD